MNIELSLMGDEAITVQTVLPGPRAMEQGAALVRGAMQAPFQQV